MDQKKIGKFIASCRKEQNMTQSILAEKVGVSDRAVSKWETGKSLPDSGIMLELCEYLEISVNELLSGEKITMEKYDKYAEANLLSLKEEAEEYAKRLLSLETFIGVSASVSYLVLIFTASFIEMEKLARIILIALGIVIFAMGWVHCLVIEQKVGYYQCQHCHHKYMPAFKNVVLSSHKGRTRYMKCPKCGEKSWQKKVISKE